MTDRFDAYHKWLGILPKDQPANAYRLLGLELFEADRDAIAHAADRQMAHVRTFQNGPHAAESQQLLNQLSAARLLLLDIGRKADYDWRLREAVQAKLAIHSALPPQVPPKSAPPPPAVARGQPRTSSIVQSLGRGEGPPPPPVVKDDEISVLDELDEIVHIAANSSLHRSRIRSGRSGISGGRPPADSRQPLGSADQATLHSMLGDAPPRRAVPKILDFTAHPKIWSVFVLFAISLSALSGAMAAKFWPKQTRLAAFSDTPIETAKPFEDTKLPLRQLAKSIREWGGSYSIDNSQPEQPIVGVKLGLAKLDAERFQQLAQLTSLKSLDCAIVGMRDSWLDGISGLGKLENLDLSSNDKLSDAGLTFLEPLKNLKELNLRNTSVTLAGVQKLQAKLPQLSVIDAAGERHRAGELSREQAIAQLRLRATMLDGSSANLNRLSAPLDDEEMNCLTPFPELVAADFRGGKIRGPGLQHLHSDKNLTTLGLQFCPLDDAELKPLARFEQLVQLDLGDTPITDQALQFLTPLKQLQRLSLNETRITDAAMTPLAELTALREVYLRHTKISDTGLNQLLTLAELQKLDLSNTEVTDNGVRLLAALKQLTLLDLSGDSVSVAAVNELRQKLPSLIVVGPQNSPADEPAYPAAQGPTADWLARLDPGKPIIENSVRGSWTKTSDGILSAATRTAYFACGIPTKQYDLEVTVTRKEGNSGLTLIFPIVGQMASLTVDADHGRSTYLESVAGNPFPSSFGATCRPHLLPGDAPHNLILRVRDHGVCLFCDGHRVLQWTGDVQQLSLPNIWDGAAKTYVSIAATKTSYEFTKIEVRPLGLDPPTAPEMKPPVPPKIIVRRAVPDEKALLRAKAEVQSIYQSDLTKAVTANARAALAEMLVKRAAEIEDKPALRYALLSNAGELALLARTPQMMSKIADQMAEDFQVSAAVVKANWLLPFLNSADANKGGVTIHVKAALTVAEELLELEQTSLAQSLVDRSQELAADVIGRQLHLDIDQMAARVSVCQRRRKSATQALETLKTSPADADANLAVGRYLCLVRHDWKTGLPYLAKGADANLKVLAERDLKSPADASEQLQLADAWWDYAPAAEENLPHGAKLRAQFWYQQAHDRLKAIELDKADRRIEEAQSLFKNTNAAAAKN